MSGKKKPGRKPDLLDDMLNIRFNDKPAKKPVASSTTTESVTAPPGTPAMEIQPPPPTTTGLPQEIALWLTGGLSMPPTGVKDALQDINDKTTWVVAFSMIQQLARVNRLAAALEHLEKDIFDKDKMETYELPEKLRIHRTLHNDMLSILDFSRKFIAQNQEVLLELSKSRDELIDLVRNLDRDVLARLRDALRGI